MDLSTGGLLASLLVGLVGTGLFLYGKKTLRIPHLVCGLALSVYPFFLPAFLSGAAWILGIGTALVLALWGAVRAGM